MKRLLCAMAIGAALAYFFDPDLGRPRRDRMRRRIEEARDPLVAPVEPVVDPLTVVTEPAVAGAATGW